jgi:hypothetical protein
MSSLRRHHRLWLFVENLGDEIDEGQNLGARCLAEVNRTEIGGPSIAKGARTSTN